MQKYVQSVYIHDPFHLFSAEHVVTLAIIALLAILLFLFREAVKRPKVSRFLRYLFVFLLLGSQIGYQIWMIATGRWSVRTSLSLQLSDLSVYLSAILLLTNSRKLFVFLYFVGIGSSIQALATPDLGMFSFPHIRYILFFISHGSVFLSCLLMAIIGTYKLRQRSLWGTVLIVNVYGVCIYLLDRWLGANYMYLTKKPGGSSLLDVLGPWPWYIASAEAIMIASFYILFWLYRMFKK
ncbi:MULTISPECIES: TIGR02206 family membrane protein [Bacillus amyloliquefaciens group]|uniref:YwaF family protein n=1 Tax=Bacillus amyloliquefaciens group TaxID=1938374 RepID=UPI0007A5722F|nr:MULTISPECIES: TIGR02206 family membrane protein [Bacillus amyloliquefaciens group]ATL41381.1 TIGR02206 family membrane protein [Bacillus velezensis]MEA1005275.1 TIGR02206 family membrane protein [Bacillus velezensis]RCX33894.1 putative integral membrane protein (TIGR02206 family) [Bacillus amyloliquefaciens]USQ53564.1 TIGR02206 family membrane protein [Bacillus velezensis]UUY38264.1 TIGR02206 family membrane protein [Bacillus velezensis]